MGSGKGNPEHWVAVVKPGRVLFELSGVPEPIAREAMRLAIHKLPIKARFIVARGRGVADGARPRELRELDRRRARSTALARGEGGAVQPPLPARDRSARQHRRASRRCAATIARIDTLLREREIAAAEQLEAQE